MSQPDISCQHPENSTDDFFTRPRNIHAAEALNLDQLDTKLETIPSERGVVFRSPLSSYAPTPVGPTEEEEYEIDVKAQTNLYNELLKLGGRPSHPVCLLRNVANHFKYNRIVSFWQTQLDSGQGKEWAVFEPQLLRWQDFQLVQRFARGERGVHDHLRKFWVDTHRRECLAAGRVSPDEISVDEEAWQAHLRLKRYPDPFTFRYLILERRCKVAWYAFVKPEDRSFQRDGFSAYAKVLKERLVKHGFTEDYQLQEDVSQQDPKTTWIEYLGYEYWWYDRHVECADPEKDKLAWEKLVNAKVLNPGETEEDVRNKRGLSGIDHEEWNARRAMFDAASIPWSFNPPLNEAPDVNKESFESADQRALYEAAQKEWETVRKCNGFIREFIHQTHKTSKAQKRVKEYQNFLPWIRAQLVEIGDEMRAESELPRLSEGEKHDEVPPNKEPAVLYEEGTHVEPATGPNGDAGSEEEIHKEAETPNMDRELLKKRTLPDEFDEDKLCNDGAEKSSFKQQKRGHARSEPPGSASLHIKDGRSLRSGRRPEQRNEGQTGNKDHTGGRSKRQSSVGSRNALLMASPNNVSRRSSRSSKPQVAAEPPAAILSDNTDRAHTTRPRRDTTSRKISSQNLTAPNTPMGAHKVTKPGREKRPRSHDMGTLRRSPRIAAKVAQSASASQNRMKPARKRNR